MTAEPINSVAISHSIRRILYATDLGPEPDLSLDYAITLALTNEAKLFLLHVVPSPQGHQPSAAEAEKIHGIFKALIATYMNPAAVPTLDWESVVTTGDIAEAIVSEAVGREIDLIVMRSRRRPISAKLLGSTAENVCRTAPCPVFVTHPYEHEWLEGIDGQIEIKRVLVACDFSRNAKLALSYGLLFAKKSEAEVHLLHVLPEGTESPWSPLFGNPAFRSLNRLDYYLPKEARERFNFVEAVAEGEPYQQIVNYAIDNEIDLICIGGHSEEYGYKPLFGTNADLILHNAPCPILIARGPVAFAAGKS